MILLPLLAMAISTAKPYGVIGHRGLGKANPSAPENGLETLVSALKNGAAAVEFDVQLSRDGEVILAHDEALDRITDGRGCVGKKSAAELRSLHLRDGSGRVHSGQRVSTLAEALRAIRPFARAGRFVADIHVKVYDGLHGDLAWPKGCPPTPYRTLTARVAQIVRDQDMLDAVFVTSFDIRVLEQFRRLEPGVRLGLLSLLSTRLALARARASRLDAVVTSDLLLTRGDADLAHSLGLSLLVWFPFSESRGVAVSHADGVVSDHPDVR